MLNEYKHLYVDEECVLVGRIHTGMLLVFDDSKRRPCFDYAQFCSFACLSFCIQLSEKGGKKAFRMLTS